MGQKMLLSDFLEISSWVSLAVILLALLAGILASSWAKKKELEKDSIGF